MHVKKKAPMNPSQVFLGDSLMNVDLKIRLPNEMPQKYAQQSFATTRDDGSRNQNRPDIMFSAANFI